MQKKVMYHSLGRPFSPIYSSLMRMRAIAYQKGLLAKKMFPVPVISVGNLTLGGTGKTPMVQYIARLLQKEGYRPAIISRGYGGKASAAVNIVSDGQEIHMDALEAGDEPRLLAETLSEIPVLTGIVRVLPAKKAISMGANVLILDDGFQHMRVERDVNLVLFNTDTLAGNSRVFPGGDLREPVSALHRATQFLLTGADPQNYQRAEQFAELLAQRFPGIPTAISRYEASGLVQLNEQGRLMPLDGFHLPHPLEKETPCYVFCGIASPERFRSSVENCGFSVAAGTYFSDHAIYKQQHMDRLVHSAQKAGAKFLLTTEKDLVKLRQLDIPLPLFAIRMEVQEEGQVAKHILESLTLAS